MACIVRRVERRSTPRCAEQGAVEHGTLMDSREAKPSELRLPQVGQKVTISGSRRRPDLNGLQGEILGDSDNAGRLEVRVDRPGGPGRRRSMAQHPGALHGADAHQRPSSLQIIVNGWHFGGFDLRSMPSRADTQPMILRELVRPKEQSELAFFCTDTAAGLCCDQRLLQRVRRRQALSPLVPAEAVLRAFPDATKAALLVLAEHTLTSAACGSAVVWAIRDQQILLSTSRKAHEELRSFSLCLRPGDVVAMADGHHRLSRVNIMKRVRGGSSEIGDGMFAFGHGLEV
ncbi:unnamed protein product [Cladocopium goreaui]|uniref:Uncharacterized protein n=1 Tax=Cladocopium goreaui TaxID=2562237 RepID=A0A9P1CZE1_9DINO|nr:unnamed protein product [Cladocopium goreaui]